MADINERKRDDNDTGEAGRTDVGVVPGDTIASALDPFGTVAADALDNKAGEGTVDDDSHGSKTRD
ncbi:hypothetical protein F7731_18535 [Cytobacillus depressus]|uniref:Uncharacterized protein n=1 Tax=Cytobacillus depressus TaxID=1602942 RepID=A0A6L3V6J4_9BACI|nr:hypothetical protein [Cytobacillus depressus]KAB2331573.1 hypothetical protein F7731_18535 [Cytobacillus depressus]